MFYNASESDCTPAPDDRRRAAIARILTGVFERAELSGFEPLAAETEPAGGDEGGQGAATAEPEAPPAKARPKRKSGRKTAPKKPGRKNMPPWKVLLHNDDKNDFEHVILTLLELTPLDIQEAKRITFEADEEGLALVLVTHKERAELYVDQFRSKSLTVTIEPAE